MSAWCFDSFSSLLGAWVKCFCPVFGVSHSAPHRTEHFPSYLSVLLCCDCDTGVGVECESIGAVSPHTGHRLDLYAILQSQRSEGVPHIMEASLRQPGLDEIQSLISLHGSFLCPVSSPCFSAFLFSTAHALSSSLKLQGRISLHSLWMPPVRRKPAKKLVWTVGTSAVCECFNIAIQQRFHLVSRHCVTSEFTFWQHKHPWKATTFQQRKKNLPVKSAAQKFFVLCWLETSSRHIGQGKCQGCLLFYIVSEFRLREEQTEYGVYRQ